MASFEVLEAWHLTAAEHVAVVREVLIPLAGLLASAELACSGTTRGHTLWSVPVCTGSYHLCSTRTLILRNRSSNGPPQAKPNPSLTLHHAPRPTV